MEEKTAPPAPQIITKESELKGCLEGVATLLIVIFMLFGSLGVYMWLTGGRMEIRSTCTIITIPPVFDINTCIPHQQ
ncbi:hypothetical protein C5B42_01730 [Candidatus Cerribacteria bacterium 'Amazon FNV 2010 28 9']|uniref:Uncharacterized protein n=1 Tax=Candidatus Cerribacteria bacterium 'Amazon FNV 2010 28 9' TaxID=2081795 RepID=A0A317JPX3_9BACT|nr:MAG: hypothetical protein C5B42_01730 [Candidatus Cerribacteria bacterium 'Amazon FNV 2010 28 9']